MSDPLADYISEEDEDYVPDAVSSDDDNDRYLLQAGVRSKGRKRRRGTSGVSITAPVRVSLDKTKNRGKVQIGAAVISSDEEEEQQHNQESTATAATTYTQTSNQQPVSHIHNNPYVHQSQKTDKGTLEEARSTSDSVPEKTSASFSLSAVKSPLTPTSPSSSGSTSLSGLLAQFNKKTSNKPAQVKKIINSWELPVTPQKAQTPPTSPATTATDQATTNTVTDVSVSSSSATAPETDHRLSTEQIQITDFTSFAGETLRVTKTVIRGSAEERAHRSTDNLTALLSSLQQKKSINTLEKSRLDWDISKQIEGDEEELKKFVSSKEGYVDKQAFLARAELREHDKKKELQEQSKKGVASSSLAGIDD